MGKRAKERIGFWRAALALLLLGLPAPAIAREILAGPVPADVIRVIDGDTVEVRARIWLGQSLEVRVRLEGVDAPELRRSSCAREKRLAEAARDQLTILLSNRRITLHDIHWGKYAGRVVARIETEDGRDVAPLLADAGLASDGTNGADAAWCPIGKPTAALLGGG